MHECYSEFRITGAALDRGDDPRLLTLRSDPSAELTLSYTLSWDPTAHTGYAYRPSVSRGHFHFFDRQWRIRPADEGERDIKVDFVDFPEEWTVYTNIDAGESPYVARARAYDNGSAEILIAGGDYIVKRQNAGGTEVAVALRPVFDNSEALAAEILAILAEQQARFGAASDRDFVVSMTGRERIRAGVKIDDSFVCLVDPETSPTGLRILVAHEAFHRWMPARASVTPDVDDDLDWYLFDWVHEGMTEYIARRMLLDSGRITRDEFVQAFNDDLGELARNPKRSATMDEVRQAVAEHRFTNREERLSYLRGPMIALMWDRELQESGGSLLDFFAGFIETCRHSGGSISETDFFDALERIGIDARADHNRFILDGEAPFPAADLLAGYTFVVEPRTLYDPGFNVGRSRRADEIHDVREDGPAYLAGLRDGDKLVNIQTEGDPAKPMTITIERNGEQNITYLPRGETVQQGRFVPEAR
jgi:predicted metalloprotease with PDZ domain